MAAGYQNLYLNQGETFVTSLTLDDANNAPYNLTGFTIASQAKKSYYTANSTITFNASISDANNGIITLSANAATTANVNASQLVYDVYIRQTSTGTVTRVLEGIIYISPAVTKTLSF
jgi:hypothetical protein